MSIEALNALMKVRFADSNKSAIQRLRQRKTAIYHEGLSYEGRILKDFQTVSFSTPIMFNLSKLGLSILNGRSLLMVENDGRQIALRKATVNLGLSHLIGQIITFEQLGVSAGFYAPLDKLLVLEANFQFRHTSREYAFYDLLVPYVNEKTTIIKLG